MNLTELVKSYLHGGPILLEWTLTGSVVESSKAQDRADICTGRLSGDPCPLNVHWIFNQQVGAGIKRIVELKNMMNLRVLGEKKLQVCSGCGGCALKPKVWMELKTILPGEEEKGKLDKRCWLLHEQP